MGTEILVAFIPVPLACWAWTLWQMRDPTRRFKAAALLILGIGFMAAFVIAGAPRYLMQSYVIGSFFYLPFHLACWGAITLAQRVIRKEEKQS